MIGPLLNLCKKSFGFANTMSTAIPFKRNFFGSGTASVRLAAGTNITNQQLYETYKTLEFKDLTIDRFASLKPVRLGAGHNTYLSMPNAWHPLYLKCSGTLTVNGSLSAVGVGNRATYYDGDTTFTSPCWSPVPISIGWGGYGYSTYSDTYYRLLEYGRTATFFDFDVNQVAREYSGTVRGSDGKYTQRYQGGGLGGRLQQPVPVAKTPLFLVGGGGGGNHHYSTGWGPFKDWHNSHVRGLGLNCGGGTPGNGSTMFGAGGGGFIALYFETLTIDGREYGVDPYCDITKISANGYSSCALYAMSGGCMIIAARHIIVGGAGKITADSEGGGGVKPCFLNNVPALCTGTGPQNEYQGPQTGVFWNELNGMYEYGTYPDALRGTYFYNDGTGENGICNRSVACDNSNWSGGGGVVLGYRVREY